LCYSLPLPRFQFDPGPDMTRFVVDKVAMEQLFFSPSIWGFPLSVLFHHCSVLTSSESFLQKDKRAKPGNLHTNRCCSPFLCCIHQQSNFPSLHLFHRLTLTVVSCLSLPEGRAPTAWNHSTCRVPHCRLHFFLLFLQLFLLLILRTVLTYTLPNFVLLIPSRPTSSPRIEPEGRLPHSLVPATSSPTLCPTLSSPHTLTTNLFDIILSYWPLSCRWPFHFRFAR
jgi:hypothetical protein